MKRLILVLACLCILAPAAQAQFRDGSWVEARVGMQAIVNPEFTYQPMLTFGVGVDRVLIDAQFGFNMTTAVDSTLLQTVGVGARLFVWSGKVWKLDKLHAIFFGTARSEAGTQKIDFDTGEVGFGIRPDVKEGNKVMTEWAIKWMTGKGLADHLAFDVNLVFVI